MKIEMSDEELKTILYAMQSCHGVGYDDYLYKRLKDTLDRRVRKKLRTDLKKTVTQKDKQLAFC